jgi:hypothetical protein
LAGSLKRELKSKHGVEPKVSFAHGELEVIVNGRSVFSYAREQKIPTVELLLKLVEDAAITQQGSPS